ncbi:MAG TPA: DNA polymerase III subunit gamma/tau, partial [Bauldia sp.]|nr:DNA polymerase III subunit gamma/tau [Bauldia sp.]
RPQSFADLIGQEPMVRTLTNAFRQGRIAQAYMLTGVRGVGKTTTARILARALNYSVPGKVDQPTIDMTEMGEHDAAIMEGRHVDVIEMDAASHTGIDDIREIIEAVRYKPAIARYKVYIIDEVHMLSKAAFNGLLKTLEEPPEHVKFIFATTEVRKVPVTVLSRCQRFDLRRIEASRLIGLMKDIAGKETIDVEDAALTMIARAAEGSARDSLSLLDQAIAHGAAKVTAEDVRQMLGLADRAMVIDLFEETMKGEVAPALARLKALYDVGADPVVVLEELAAFTHLVTRLKLAPNAEDDAALTEEEKTRGKAFAEKVSLRVLARTWQMLLKGIEEAREASRPLAATDMVIVRIAHAADLPTPDEALKSLAEGNGAAPPRPGAGAPPRSVPSAPPRMAMAAGGGAGRPAPQVQSAPQAAPKAAVMEAPRLETFADLVALAGAERELKLKNALETTVRPVRFEPPQIEVALTEHAAAGLVNELARKLEQWTGQRWVIAVARDGGAMTIDEQRKQARARLVDDAKADPLVAAVQARFPGAEIVDVRLRGEEPPLAAPPADEGAGGDDSFEDISLDDNFEPEI